MCQPNVGCENDGQEEGRAHWREISSLAAPMRCDHAESKPKETGNQWQVLQISEYAYFCRQIPNEDQFEIQTENTRQKQQRGTGQILARCHFRLGINIPQLDC